MPDQFSRTKLLIGETALNKLQNSRVAIFGIGGVGGYVCEALVRAGVGSFDIIDDDKVSLSNLNRQITATYSSIGEYKVDVMKKRMLDINKAVVVNTYKCFFLPENAGEFHFEKYDYVVDAVDTVTSKLEIITRCKEKGVPVISAMGAGNKLDASSFEIADIYDTSVCPLAKVLRRELRKRDIKSLKVVYSKEEPIKRFDSGENPNYEEGEKALHLKRNIPASISYVPAVAGLMMAGEIIKDICSK